VAKDVIASSPVPLVKGDLLQPTGKVSTAGFSRGTYNKEWEEYRKWV
jgi:hypothetical protein